MSEDEGEEGQSRRKWDDSGATGGEQKREGGKECRKIVKVENSRV